MAKVAKTVKQVKEWIKQPHHVGEALTKDRKRDPKPGEVYYLKLSGHSPTKGYHSILIPQPLLEKCFLNSTGNSTHMYEWDDEAERAANEAESMERTASILMDAGDAA